ncbi:MAG: hypothetical protein HQL72_02365 [Magnetococcales bacterium]|nr:hypothetical protein [Magnetococcales bacterium]
MARKPIPKELTLAGANAKRLAQHKAVCKAALESLKKDDSIDRVEIIPAHPDSACPECKKIHGIYPIETAPLLPNSNCTNDWCGCYYMAVFADE